ncbi:YceI family protein, partial [bacterium]|nr:YceI family protein [bacterium]
KVKHMMVSKVQGVFNDFSGTLEFDETNLENWSTTATIQAASVDSGDQKRDEHLKGADFFDVETFPLIKYESKGVEKKGDHWIIHGELTMHGVTKHMMLKMEFNGAIDDPWGNHRAGFTAEGKIDRTEFGIKYNSVLDQGGLAVGNDVSIILEIEAIRQ